MMRAALTRRSFLQGALLAPIARRFAPFAKLLPQTPPADDTVYLCYDDQGLSMYFTGASEVDFTLSVNGFIFDSNTAPREWRYMVRWEDRDGPRLLRRDHAR
jgi:hypothetical protein